MFYDILKELCEKRNVSPSKAATECGISRSTVTWWKQHKTNPNSEQVSKLADYFGVSTDYLLGNEQKEKPFGDEAEGPIDEAARELLEQRRVLASKSKKATVEQLKQMNKIIDALIGDDDSD